MGNTMKRLYNREKGFTLIEVLISILLAGIVTTATMQFYVSEHNNMLAQHDISDMQQNLRACVQELTSNLRNAGSNIPNELLAIESSDGNPDSLTIRYSPMGGSATIGENTPITEADPIHIDTSIDISSFQTGMTVFLWHNALKIGEWFTITSIVPDNGAGWAEIHHMGQPFTNAPMPGDQLIQLEESSYFIDAVDSTNLLFMKITNGGTPQVYAESINDFQLQFILSTSDTVTVIGVNDTVHVVNVTMTAQTSNVDFELANRSQDGRRHRTLSTDILIRNNRF